MNKYTALNYFKIIITACLAVLFSCQQKSPSSDIKPEGLVSQENMVRILIDVHMTESALSLKNFNRDSSLSLYAYYKEEIYKEHNVTEKQFKESFDYYSKHSQQLNSIYEAVIDSIDVKEATGKIE